MEPTTRIVITGGPASGKTHAVGAIARAAGDRIAIVPEAATQLHATTTTRWEHMDVASQRAFQKRIYLLQRQQEDRIIRENPGKIILLDRGTVDGALYWPDGPQAYWQELGTTLEAELARYDRVIWLETMAVLGMYDRNASNKYRFEDATGAVENGEQLFEHWGKHHDVLRVTAYETMEEKIAAIMRALRM
jgi:predicted ATPase